MIRLIKKKAKSIVCSVLAAVTLFTMNPAVFATETATQTDTVSSVDVSGSDSSDAADKSNTDSTADSTTTAGSEANDKVTISNNDKPYLSLGATSHRIRERQCLDLWESSSLIWTNTMWSM